VKIEDIKGFDAPKNASIIKNIFQKKIKDAKLDIVAINAATLFWASDKVQKLEDGLSISYNLIEQGLAYKKLEELK
jgi:anthranilate phosphoribosyltransferase